MQDFDTFYQEQFSRIFRYSFRRLGNFHDSEEITSEVFSAAWAGWESLASEANREAWLMGIARHKLADYLRRKYRISAQVVTLASDNFENLPERNPLTTEVVEDHSATTTLLARACALLSVTEQEFVQRRWGNQEKLASLAEHFQKTLNATKVWQNRILQKLRENYEQLLTDGQA